MAHMKMSATVLAGVAMACPALATRYYVDVDATGADDGSSWSDAFTDLQDAIDAVTEGDEVWVAEGTYYPSAQLDPTDVTTTTMDARDATFLVYRAVEFYGGFDGTESMLSQRAGLYSTTILSGDIGTTGVATDNSYRVLIYAVSQQGGSGVHSAARLDGFTVTGGYNDRTTAYNGGGMTALSNYVSGSARGPLEIANCTFEENYADGSGGGLYTGGGGSRSRTASFSTTSPRPAGGSASPSRTSAHQSSGASSAAIAAPGSAAGSAAS